MKNKHIFNAITKSLCALPIIALPAYGANIINNGSFDDGALSWEEPGWWGEPAGSGVFDIDAQGRACLTVIDEGGNTWGAQLRQGGLSFTTGNEYTLSFTAWTSAPATIDAGTSIETPCCTTIFEEVALVIDAPLDGAGFTYSNTFTATADNNAAYFRFMLGGGNVPAGETICFDDIAIEDPNYVEPVVLPVAAQVQASQHGYLPSFTKRATYVVPGDSADLSSPRPWALMSGDTQIATGETIDQGFDQASGQVIHSIDFSDISQTGSNYTIVVTEGDMVVVSYPFDIAYDLYDDMKKEALAYFYHNRSGSPILEDVVTAEFAREAGHQEDMMVPSFECLTMPDMANVTATLESFDETALHCRTGVNGWGGWYDAGDHGKYVVNGGISVWTLMNQYERAISLGLNAAEFGDGSLMLPEAEGNNGIPDILDEARYQMEWMLKMQIPEGEAQAGMVHHKLADITWSGLPLRPALASQDRFLFPVTTAATLNLAATAAQCSRVFRPFDIDFAERCLSAAKNAYTAAQANPAIRTINWSIGSGGYGDGNTTDEFYWASAELYAATGDASYKANMVDSNFHLTVNGDADDFTTQSLMSWGSTHFLGTISLAVAGIEDEALNAQVKAVIVAAADTFVAETEKGYGLPIAGTSVGWGSNSLVVNNMIGLGLANDFTCDTKYVDAMQVNMSYLMGRNPLAQSYITGYGEKATSQPHHRFWANVLDDTFPSVPSGVLAGGPNPALQDPVSAAAVSGCAPLKCYVDDIQGWSTNEITINWNAPLAWVVAYLDEAADSSAPQGQQLASCPLPAAKSTNTPPPHQASKRKSGGASIWFGLILLLLIPSRLRKGMNIKP
ncbi:glycoside hydrolase family 9 protein [Marinagarivorans cellulosilyticus]|uniref:Endoglucanase n=1 Tax=Marinagarivorans cellulosilyticus TaxID=2721545 RepID=A0AAN1WGY0_9GAMM|nr:glycoside hydrolase family 9 protein [Marinagarivorans cellulosilyticus]BCD97340.1 endoglucanase [Marinagarivorans cellulosilyticus]